MIWLMLVYVDVLLHVHVVSGRGFNFLGSWSFSKEWVWNLGTKCMLHCFKKVKCKLGDTPRSSLPDFNVSYRFL